MNNIFSGVITALITPFKDGHIDFGAVDKLLARQLEAGVNKIVVAGSTGEGATLTEEEKVELCQYTSNFDNRIEVIACVGGSSTMQAIDLAKSYEKVGAKAFLCTSPSYNKPNQTGLYEHFANIHNNTKLPIMIYNHPGRTGVDISIENVKKIADLDRINAMKDANPDLSRILQLKIEKPDFAILAGDDGAVLAAMANGAVGLVSVISNLMPKEIRQIITNCRNNDFANALKLLSSIYGDICFTTLDTNPVPIKFMCHKAGLCEAEVRLPLVALNSKLIEQY